MLKSISVLLIASVWGFYYFNFGINGTLSQSSEVWGQFGDYVGGVVNPLLGFITIYLLIQSLTLQREANTTLITQIKAQEKLEEFKKFELRLFSLIEAQEVNFNKLSILTIKDTAKDNEAPNVANLKLAPEIIELKGSGAVNYIDENLGILVRANVSSAEIVEWLDSLDMDDHFFSVARRFYLVVKLIDDKIFEEERDEQYETLLNLTDMKILVLIVILCHYYYWDNIEYIRSSKILEREGLDKYVENYKRLST